MKKCIILMVMFAFMSTSLLQAEDNFLNILKNDENLCMGNVDTIVFKGKEYLISVGSSPIDSNTPEAKLKAREEARLIAEESLMKFVYQVQVDSAEELKTEHTEMINKNGKSKVRIEEKYIEIIKEKGKGILKRLTPYGKWKSKDKAEYYFAVGITL